MSTAASTAITTPTMTHSPKLPKRRGINGTSAGRLSPATCGALYGFGFIPLIVAGGEGRTKITSHAAAHDHQLKEKIRQYDDEHGHYPPIVTIACPANDQRCRRDADPSRDKDQDDNRSLHGPRHAAHSAAAWLRQQAVA